MDKLDDGNVKKLARMKIWKTHEDIIENVDKGIMGKWFRQNGVGVVEVEAPNAQTSTERKHSMHYVLND